MARKPGPVPEGSPRTADGDGNEGHLLIAGQPKGAQLERAHADFGAEGPLGKEQHPLTLMEKLGDGLEVGDGTGGDVAVDEDVAGSGEEWTDVGLFTELTLDHEPGVDGESRGAQDEVEVPAMVGDEDGGARTEALQAEDAGAEASRREGGPRLGLGDTTDGPSGGGSTRPRSTRTDSYRPLVPGSSPRAPREGSDSRPRARARVRNQPRFAVA